MVLLKDTDAVHIDEETLVAADKRVIEQFFDLVQLRIQVHVVIDRMNRDLPLRALDIKDIAAYEVVDPPGSLEGNCLSVDQIQFLFTPVDRFPKDIFLYWFIQEIHGGRAEDILRIFMVDALEDHLRIRIGISDLFGNADPAIAANFRVDDQNIQIRLAREGIVHNDTGVIRNKDLEFARITRTEHLLDRDADSQLMITDNHVIHLLHLPRKRNA